MRAIIQRVKMASVEVAGEEVSSIGPGMLILLGVADEDNTNDLLWLAGKVSRMRIFGDEQGNMNLSLTDVGGEVLVVSQFTLYASTKKGNRPSFIRSAPPEKAKNLYHAFIAELQKLTGGEVKQGVFGAMMDVSLINEGPVTIIIDSKLRE